MGIAPNNNYAYLNNEVTFKKPLTNHLLIKSSVEDGKILANPVANSGSGDLVHLALADGFLSLPAEKDTFKKGEIFPITFFHQTGL